MKKIWITKLVRILYLIQVSGNISVWCCPESCTCNKKYQNSSFLWWRSLNMLFSDGSLYSHEWGLEVRGIVTLERANCNIPKAKDGSIQRVQHLGNQKKAHWQHQISWHMRTIQPFTKKQQSNNSSNLKL